MSDKLTKQQARALRAFLYVYSATGIDPETCGAAVWDCGVRPWPTMDNLVAKGLVEMAGWFGPDEGHGYRLTEAGYAEIDRLFPDRERGRKVSAR